MPKPKMTSQNPPAANVKESLISSDTLPEFDDLEAEYASAMASVEEDRKEKPKRGKGKSVVFNEGETVETTEEDLLVEPEEMSDIFGSVFDSYYIRHDKEILSDIERKALGRSIAKVVNKWGSKIGGKWKEEIGLCICIGAIAGSRAGGNENEKTGKEISKDNEKSSSLSI